MIKLALRTADLLDADFATAAALARKVGFAGIELHEVSRPDQVRSRLRMEYVEVSSIKLNQKIEDLPRQIALAEQLHCRQIRISIDDLLDRSGVITPIATHQLCAAGKLAASANVTILLENQPTRDSVTRLWQMLDRLNHPQIACSWDLRAGQLAGDLPTVAVPLLNSRIQLAESQIDPDNLTARKALNRLRGVGFAGYLIVSATNPQTAADLEQRMHSAVSTLRQWKVIPSLDSPKPVKKP